MNKKDEKLSAHEAMERADKAMRELLKQKPESHREMVERRRRGAKGKRK
jgi:hypothetical protein